MERLFKNHDTNEIVNEQTLRFLLFDYEMNFIYENLEEYTSNNIEFDLKTQLDIVRNAIYGDIENVLYNLETSWCIYYDEV